MGTILLSLFLTNLIKDETFFPSQVYVLFLLFFSIGLWITEAIPPFAVGIMIVGYLVFFLGQPGLENDIQVTKFVNTWSDSVIWLLLGGFFLAEGLRKTGMDVDIFRLVTKHSGENPSHLLLVLMFTTAVISMIMSNTATTAMMLAALMPLITKMGEGSSYSKCLLLGIPVSAAIGGMGTIIGSPPNAIAVDMINRLPQYEGRIEFLDWMLIGVPVALILILLVWFLLKWKYEIPDEIDLEILANKEDQVDYEPVYMGGWNRKKVVSIVLILTIGLWMTEGLHPIPMAAVSGIPIIALTMMNIIGAEDVRALPWDTLMLVAGGLSLGLAIQDTQLMDYFLESLRNISLPIVVLIILFAGITVTASNFMSNTAAAAILIPACALWKDIDPMVLPLIIAYSASCALFLPVSTPPNAIAYSTGLLDQKDFRHPGILVGIIGPLLITISVLIFLPLIQ